MVTYPMTGAVPSRTSRTARRAAADSRAARQQALAIDPVLRCPGLRRPNHCDPVTTFHLPGGKPESVPKARSPGESMEKNQFRLTVNGAERSVTCEPDTPLLDALRHDLGLAGPKFGCGTGLCGACFVLIEGRARASCDLPVSAVGGPVTEVLPSQVPAGGTQPVEGPVLAPPSVSPSLTFLDKLILRV